MRKTGAFESVSRRVAGVRANVTLDSRSRVRKKEGEDEEDETKKTNEYYETFFMHSPMARASTKRYRKRRRRTRTKNVKAYFSEHTRQILLHETEDAVLVGDDAVAAAAAAAATKLNRRSARSSGM